MLQGAWMLDDQVAGYLFKNGDYHTFLTVKEAGHMVPSYKPKEALAFFTRFIKGKPI
jgi:serine carboxypeptidase-like clade 1